MAEASGRRRPKAEDGAEARPKEEAADEPLPLAPQPYPQSAPGTCPFWAHFPQKREPGCWRGAEGEAWGGRSLEES